MIAYLITNNINGRQYVGITTKTLRRRWTNHKANAVIGSQLALPRAIRKYGVENFTTSVIACGLSVSSLLELEKYLIRQYKTRSPNGYNMTDGGDGTHGLTHSPEARKKIGLASTGRTCTEVKRTKLRAAHLGKTLSENHRAKLSAAKMGKKMPKRSPEHCAKISAGLRAAHLRRPEWRPWNVT